MNSSENSRWLQILTLRLPAMSYSTKHAVYDEFSPRVHGILFMLTPSWIFVYLQRQYNRPCYAKCTNNEPEPDGTDMTTPSSPFPNDVFILFPFLLLLPVLRLDLFHRPLQLLHPSLPEPRNFLHIPRCDLTYSFLRRSFPDQCLGRHGKSHISWPVHKLQDRGRRLIVITISGLDAKDTGIAPWAREVALADGGEEGRED